MIVTLNKRVCEEFEDKLKEKGIEYTREGRNFNISADEIVIFFLGGEYRDIINRIKSEDERKVLEQKS